MGFLALVCLIIAGAAVAGFIVARDGILVLPSETFEAPVANRDGKTDRLPTAFAALASIPRTAPSPATPSPTDLLRQAYASASPLADPEADPAGSAVAPIAVPPLPSPRPRAADLPPWQKSYTLLSDLQIAAIKGRLQLTEAQAKYWPPVEQALRSITQKLHTRRQAESGKTRGGSTVALSGVEARELETAAAPLLRQLRDDQKREVRGLARMIGLDMIASRI